MKKLLYRLASSRSMAKVFSMDAQLEERKRVIFFAVLALLAFVSLGAFVFPHAAHAQCVWDCDLGSDPFFNPWGNSPQSQLDIAYCIDQGCVFQNLIPILGPIPSANTDVVLDITPLPPQTCTNGGNSDVTISGFVVAWLKDASGNLIPGSPAQARLFKKIKCATLAGNTGATTLTRAVVAKEAQSNVFEAGPNIKISARTQSQIPSQNSLKHLPGGGVRTAKTKGPPRGQCASQPGFVLLKNEKLIATTFPPAPPPLPYLQG